MESLFFRMLQHIPRYRKSSPLHLWPIIAVWILAGAAAQAQQPCASKNGGGSFPCSIGGTLVVLSRPTGSVFSGSGSVVGAGTTSFVEDPENPGLSATATIPLQFTTSTLPTVEGSFSLGTASGEPTINGVRGAIICGVTGAASFAMTLSTPRGQLVLNCPKVSAPGMVVTVEGQINFAPVNSLVLNIGMLGAAQGSDVVTLGGFSFQIPDQNFIGSMPDIVAEENWTTLFTLVNKTGSPTQVNLSLFGDVSDPNGNGPLTLPLDFPQNPPPSGPLLAPSYSGQLAANASLIINTGGPQTPPVLIGSAQLAATGLVDGFAIFDLLSQGGGVPPQEAVVPLETRYASSYVLGFDNTSGVVLGVAVANVSDQAANIPVVIRDENGVQIGTGMVSLVANGHTSFVLSDPMVGFPMTANIRGTVEFDTPAGGQISVLGVRTTPLGATKTLTTIPPLANVGTIGGSFPFVASGGDGWQTTFVLINTGTNNANATLSFFDPTGNPMSMPVSYPQTGNGAFTMNSSVAQMIAAGASLTVLSAGAPTLLEGSAQLTTSGNISGFAIFRYNPTGQEAVVPIESRNATGYLLAFDNTSSIATSISVNNVTSGQAQVNIPVVIRDDSGNLLGQHNLQLPPNGEFSGVLAQAPPLGAVLFPETANIRGTIEFDTPAGAQIGVLGVRTPPSHTYTTLPALAK